MPYRTVYELPDSVQDNLPRHAQEIYKAAYNAAWEEYADPSKRREFISREEVSHRMAWTAVKKEYVRNQYGRWVRDLDNQ